MKKIGIMLVVGIVLGGVSVFGGDAPHTILDEFEGSIEQVLVRESARLHILAARPEVQLGDWPVIKQLLLEGASSDVPALYWYCLPDGSYYTSEKDRVDASLSGRSYFPQLQRGEDVLGALIVGKTSGLKSAVVAVPVLNGVHLSGFLGASIYLKPLQQRLIEEVSIPDGWVCFCLDSEGVTALDTSDENLILDRPLEQDQSPSLVSAVQYMLDHPSGATTYNWGGVDKAVLFTEGEYSGWRYALAVPILSGDVEDE